VQGTRCRRLLSQAAATERSDTSTAVTEAAPARAAANASAPVPVPMSRTRRPAAYSPSRRTSINKDVSLLTGYTPGGRRRNMTVIYPQHNLQKLREPLSPTGSQYALTGVQRVLDRDPAHPSTFITHGENKAIVYQPPGRPRVHGRARQGTAKESGTFRGRLRHERRRILGVGEGWVPAVEGVGELVVEDSGSDL
jgi:hypothetical protein